MKMYTLIRVQQTNSLCPRFLYIRVCLATLNGIPLSHSALLLQGAIVVVIEWWLNLQLHVQSEPIITDAASSNPVQERCT